MHIGIAYEREAKGKGGGGGRITLIPTRQRVYLIRERIPVRKRDYCNKRRNSI